MDPVRIDLGLRIVATVHDYRRAGVLMDDLHDAITALLLDSETDDQPLAARFDFTHFQTRPCKANRMAAFVEASDMEVPGALVDGPMPGGPF